MSPGPAAAPAGGALELVINGQHRQIPPGRPFVIGRGAEVDLDLGHPKVSRRHLVLTPGPNGWTMSDHSSNGTFVGNQRITELQVTSPITLRLGSAVDGALVHLLPANGAAPGPADQRRPADGAGRFAGDQCGIPQPGHRATPPGGRGLPPAGPGAPPAGWNGLTPNGLPPNGPLVPGPPPNRRPPGPPGLPGPAGIPNSPIARQGTLSAVHELTLARVTIGRLPDNDVVIDDLLVSRRHAVLEQTPRGWMLRDRGSGNGTFVGGHRITQTPITENDVIGIGRTLLQLDGGRLVAYVDDGSSSFEADSLTVTTNKGKTLLHSVSFALPARSLLAVIGPSGAGKSTLLNALIGAKPANQGTVRYADRDLYEDYDELRHRIALVPQDDVLHTALTVRQALSYAARLRFPADTTAADRMHRVEEVLAELNLSAQSDQLITSLSGGQRKRTSVALELLTKPSLLFLDEPTSGLDPGMDRSVMHTLRTLADDARTVVVVTHNVANLEVCDKLLLLAPGGWIAYFGPPSGALRYFGKADFAEIFLLLETASGQEWAERFARSPEHRANVEQRANAARRRPGGQGPPGPPPPPGRRQNGPGPGREAPAIPKQQRSTIQFWVLCRRYLAVIASDRQYAIFLIVLPLVLSLLARAVPGSAGLSVSTAAATDDPQPQQLLLVLIIGACLMGSAAAVRELVKERPIYRRERAIGLSIPAYLASKVVILTLITGVQAAIFTLLSLWGRNPPDETLIVPSGDLEILLAVLLVTVTSMLVGLVISAAIDNADRGMPLLVLVIMIQLIFCGGLFAVYDRPVLEQLSWFVPARWGFSMTAATTDLGAITRGTPDPLWDHTVSAWVTDAGLLLAIAIVLTGLLVYQLSRLDPPRSRKR